MVFFSEVSEELLKLRVISCLYSQGRDVEGGIMNDGCLCDHSSFESCQTIYGLESSNFYERTKFKNLYQLNTPSK